MTDVRIPSVTGGVVERYPGGRITCSVKAGQVVSGGDLVELTGAATGNEVQRAGALSNAVLGIALFDGNGDLDDQDKVTVATVGVWDLKAVGAVNAGDKVACAANGQIQTVAANYNVSSPPVDTQLEAQFAVVGVALEDIANGQRGAVLLRVGGSL